MTTKTHIIHPRPASAEFWQVWGGTSSPSVQCEECGRTVYCPSGMEAGESLRYEESDTCIADTANDGVFSMYVFGVHCVYGCPCNAAGRLEERLLANELDLVTWLNMRRKQLTARLGQINESIKAP